MGDNFGRQLSQFRERLLSFVKLVTRFRRTAATHILVVMISTEDRRSKPYALPIQLLPYVGIQDMEARTLMNKVIQEMVNRGMKVSGMWILQAWRPVSFNVVCNEGLTANGGWNSLRTKGNTRPLSILQLRSEARAKYSRLGFKRMMNMLTPRG